MHLFVGQDNHGNIHIVDDKDLLPDNMRDSKEYQPVWLEEKLGFSEGMVTIEIAGRKLTMPRR